MAKHCGECASHVSVREQPATSHLHTRTRNSHTHTQTRKRARTDRQAQANCRRRPEFASRPGCKWTFGDHQLGWMMAKREASRPGWGWQAGTGRLAGGLAALVRVGGRVRARVGKNTSKVVVVVREDRDTPRAGHPSPPSGPKNPWSGSSHDCRAMAKFWLAVGKAGFEAEKTMGNEKRWESLAARQ